MAAVEASQQLYELLSSDSEISFEKVKSLLKDGADPCFQVGTTKSSPLFLCIVRNNESLLHLLLSDSQKINLGATNADGLNVLMLAAKLGHVGCVNLLLSSGFNVPELINRKTRSAAFQATSLMLACMEGHIDVVRVLLQNGADPSLCDSRGRSVVHIAAIQGQLELLQELKQHGVDLAQVIDDLGNTPMHFCTHPHVHIKFVPPVNGLLLMVARSTKQRRSCHVCFNFALGCRHCTLTQLASSTGPLLDLCEIFN